MEKKHKQLIGALAAFLLVILFLFLAVLMYYNWIPFPWFLFHPVIIALGFIAVLGSGLGYGYYKYQQDSTPGYDFRKKTEKQLTSKKAENLLEYYALNQYGVKVGEIHESGVDNVTDPTDSSEAIRLFKLVFEPKLLSETIGLYLSLEQEDIRIEDPRDPFELEQALEQVHNIRSVRSSKVDDFDEKMDEIRSSLGKSLAQKRTTVEYDDEGNVVREKSEPIRVALRRRQNQESSTEAEEQEVK
ncbi:hypothetical protein OB919_15770 [Halobacteria archaeon AArc-curdl1]|uniref:Uncharacterized protein n=1 Tax=Natronosalvus hydrolyticus TaxID=2979988 RepID=A0AAP2Z9Z5_9EURY|nr:hypothetical protein [Halobacteria archaeon AArc-curdl1]